MVGCFCGQYQHLVLPAHSGPADAAALGNPGFSAQGDQPEHFNLNAIFQKRVFGKTISQFSDLGGITPVDWADGGNHGVSPSVQIGMVIYSSDSRTLQPGKHHFRARRGI